jgi:hypothetical protein
MFFPNDPVQAIQGAQSLSLNYLYARALGYSPTQSTNVTGSGLLQIQAGFTVFNFSSGLSVTGLLTDAALVNFKIYNRGNPVTLVNLSGAVAQVQRMILPSGANTVLGNNQWAEFFFDFANGNCWRVLL